MRTFDGHGGAVTSVCLSSDGRYALSGSTDATVKLWEVAGGQCLRTFAGHADAVTSVTFSADGRCALSGSADRTLKLWVLDWELADHAPADWDEGALPYLEMFLSLHTPYAAPSKGTSPLSRLFRSPTAEEEIIQAMTRQGQPVWTENDFQALLGRWATRATAGCGPKASADSWRMARHWKEPPRLGS